MKYKSEITINAPFAKVWQFYTDPESMPKWQPTFRGMEHLEGEPGRPGAVSLMKYEMRGSIEELTETIHEMSEGHMKATYATPGVVNHMTSDIIKVDENTTKVVLESEFLFSGLMMKLMGLFMPGMFKKQTQEDLARLKQAIESNA